MHRVLRLQHRKHTGKLLAHRHTSYRALAVILVLAGCLIGGAEWCLQKTANADSLYLLATVPAPIPTTAPTIDEPTEGTVFTDAVITVSGSCPVIVPAVSVAIYSNAALKGSAPCSAGGTFSAQVTLVPGDNVLTAKTITITGDYGPESDQIHVTYNQPIPPPIPPSPSPGNQANTTPSTPSSHADSTAEQAPSTNPLIIYPDQAFLVFGLSKDAVWSGHIGGGQPPYRITINWEDGTIDSYQDVDTATQHFSHRYTDMSPHLVQVNVTDTADGRAGASFSAVTPYVAPGPTGVLQGSSGSGVSSYTLFAIYSGYISTLCVVGAFWMHAHAAGYAYARASSSVNRYGSRHSRGSSTRRRK